MFVNINKPIEGLVNGKLTVGTGFNAGNRCSFDGIDVEYLLGLGSVGMTAGFPANDTSHLPTFNSVSGQLGPQPGFEANASATASLTIRDLGRLISSFISGGSNQDIIGESCQCR